MEVFWAKGYAATSTDDLIKAMKLGRQSFYNAFGDKRTMYVEALDAYQRGTTAGHLKRLDEPASALDGIRSLLTGLIAEDDIVRDRGCMGVGSVSEFGTADEALVARRSGVNATLGLRIGERIREGQASGELDPDLAPEEATAFIQLTMTGLQLAARAGAGLEDLRSMGRFAAERLRRR